MPNYITCAFCGNNKDFRISLGTQYTLNIAKNTPKSNVVVKWYPDTITCLKCGAKAKINEKF